MISPKSRLKELLRKRAQSEERSNHSRDERGQTGPGGNGQGGREEGTSLQWPRKVKQVFRGVTAFHGEKSSVTFTKGVGSTKLEVRKKSQWMQKVLSSKQKKLGEGWERECRGNHMRSMGRGGKASIPSADGKCSEGPFSLLLSFFKPIVDTHWRHKH